MQRRSPASAFVRRWQIAAVTIRRRPGNCIELVITNNSAGGSGLAHFSCYTLQQMPARDAYLDGLLASGHERADMRLSDFFAFANRTAASMNRGRPCRSSSSNSSSHEISFCSFSFGDKLLWSAAPRRVTSKIVDGICAQDPVQVRFAEYDHVVQALPADRANEPLNVSVLPG